MAQQRRVHIIQQEEAQPVRRQRPQDGSPRADEASAGASERASVNAGGDEDDAIVAMEGVYIISVAARILDMHPQTLRKYERLGLVRPGRTLGMLRLYSTDDIRKLRLIRHLSDEMGLNLAGVEFVLATVDNLLTLKQRLTARLGPEAGQAVEEELSLLFQSLNLPVDL